MFWTKSLTTVALLAVVSQLGYSRNLPSGPVDCNNRLCSNGDQPSRNMPVDLMPRFNEGSDLGSSNSDTLWSRYGYLFATKHKIRAVRLRSPHDTPSDPPKTTPKGTGSDPFDPNKEPDNTTSESIGLDPDRPYPSKTQSVAEESTPTAEPNPSSNFASSAESTAAPTSSVTRTEDSSPSSEPTQEPTPDSCPSA